MVTVVSKMAGFLSSNLTSTFIVLLLKGSFCSPAESRRASIDIFVKAAGYLDCAVRHVLPQLPAEFRYAD